jgi:hypothetical protein
LPADRSKLKSKARRKAKSDAWVYCTDLSHRYVLTILATFSSFCRLIIDSLLLHDQSHRKIGTQSSVLNRTDSQYYFPQNAIVFKAKNNDVKTKPIRPCSIRIGTKK